MVHGVVRPIIAQPLLSPPCYNTCGLNLVLLTACILTTNLQYLCLHTVYRVFQVGCQTVKCKCQGCSDYANK